jgi:cell wall-associated NlpC family hydrolase
MRHELTTPTARATRSRRLVAGFIAGLLIVPAAITYPAAADPITDKRAEAAQIAEKLNQLNAELGELSEKYNGAQVRLDEVNGQITEAQSQIDATQGELDAKRKELATFAVQAYVSGGDSGVLDTVLTTSGDKAPQKKSYLSVTSGNRQDILDALEGIKSKIANQVEDLEVQKDEAAKIAAEQKKAVDEAQTKADEQDAINDRVQGELADLVRAEQERIAAAQRAAAEQAAREQAARDAAAAQAAAQVVATRRAAAPAAPAATNGRTGGATASTGGGGTSTTTTPSGPAPAVSGGAGAAVSAAYSALGVPYVWGGASMSGFDCSGLTMWAWAKGGVSLPHYTGSQYAAGRKIPMSALQPGDLIFYNGLSHVGLYVGGGNIIHAPNRRSQVKVDSIYYWNTVVGAVRVG